MARKARPCGKKTSAVPLFHAYAVYHLRPNPLKERQEFKEEGKPWVSLPLCSRGECRSSPPPRRSPSGANPAKPVRFVPKLKPYSS